MSRNKFRNLKKLYEVFNIIKLNKSTINLKEMFTTKNVQEINVNVYVKSILH